MDYALFEILEDIILNKKLDSPTSIMEEIKEAEKEFEVIDSDKHQQIIFEIIMLSLTQIPKYLCGYCIMQHQKEEDSPFFNYIVEKSTTHKDPTIQNMVRIIFYMNFNL